MEGYSKEKRKVNTEKGETIRGVRAGEGGGFRWIYDWRHLQKKEATQEAATKVEERMGHKHPAACERQRQQRLAKN